MMGDRVWARTRNEGHHTGRLYEQAQLDAAGFDHSVTGGQPRFNGGVTAPLETRLQRGDKIYRFSSSPKTRREDQVSGCWWFDYDTCLFLWSKSRGTDQGFRDAAGRPSRSCTNGAT
jgi:hypothetical protein